LLVRKDMLHFPKPSTDPNFIPNAKIRLYPSTLAQSHRPRHDQAGTPRYQLILTVRSIIIKGWDFSTSRR
jgi:hypothetical protein